MKKNHTPCTSTRKHSTPPFIWVIWVIFRLPHLPTNKIPKRNWFTNPQLKQVFFALLKNNRKQQPNGLVTSPWVQPLAHFHAFHALQTRHFTRECGPNMHSVFESQTSHDSRSHKSLTCLKHCKIAIEHHVCFKELNMRKSPFQKNWNHLFSKMETGSLQYIKSCHLASCIHPGYQPYQLHRSTPFREHKTAAEHFPFVTVWCWMKLISNMLLKCNLCKLCIHAEIKFNLMSCVFGALA